jgi:arsenate reductase (glutaredoxin)
MTVTIWRNPKCSTSRKVPGIIVDYVKTPPSAAALKAALKGRGVKPRDLH